MLLEIALGEQFVRPLRSPKTRILSVAPHEHIGCRQMSRSEIIRPE